MRKVCKRNRFRMWIRLKKDDIFPILIQFQILLAHLTVWQYCTFLLDLFLINGLFPCSTNLNTQNALKISFKSNYVKLYNLCNLLVHIHQIQSSDSLFIHSIASILFVCLFCCFTSQVNSYGLCGAVSSPNHTFSWAGLNKRITSNSCTYFR